MRWQHRGGTWELRAMRFRPVRRDRAKSGALVRPQGQADKRDGKRHQASGRSVTSASGTGGLSSVPTSTSRRSATGSWQQETVTVPG